MAHPDSTVSTVSLESRQVEQRPAERLYTRLARPLLVVHGLADEILPETCSRDIYRRAKESKRIVLDPGCRHGLDKCREGLVRDLLGWIREVVAAPL